MNWHTEWNYWKALEKVISESYEILHFQKYSEDYLTGVYHSSRGRDPWYGIMFEVGLSKKESVCLFVERGWEDVYFGLTVQHNGDRSVTRNSAHKHLEEQIADLCDWPEEELWLGGCWCKPAVDFESFEEENSLMMTNTKHLHETVGKHWEQIQQFIKDCGF